MFPSWRVEPRLCLSKETLPSLCSLQQRGSKPDMAASSTSVSYWKDYFQNLVSPYWRNTIIIDQLKQTMLKPFFIKITWFPLVPVSVATWILLSHQQLFTFHWLCIWPNLQNFYKMYYWQSFGCINIPWLPFIYLYGAALGLSLLIILLTCNTLYPL